MPAAARRRRLLLVAPLALAVALCSLNCGGAPLRQEPLRTTVAPLTTDAHLEVARRYAPWIYHAVHPTEGRQDLPTRVDFDGTMRGDDNWETMSRWALPPVVYYAHLETETHRFLSYHLFHPRDWSYLRVGAHETHENDGENLQVVVDKATGEVVLLWVQAHYFSDVYARDGAGFSAGAEDLHAPLLLLDDEGRPSPEGRHAGVFVEDYGHGIYGAGDPCTGLAVDDAGRASFANGGIVFRPAAPGEATAEPTPEDYARRPAAVVPYHLESTTAKLWPGLADGSLVGEGGLFDGAVELETPWITVGVPRYYEGDRFSGPFGPDRGISPFALDFSFYQGRIGALFFDPAGRYPEALGVPSPWSRTYLDYPFLLDAR